MNSSSRRLLFRAAVAALLGAHLVLGFLTMAAQSPTFDETIHLAAGYVYLRTGDYRLNTLFHPPAAEMWAALPLRALNPGVPAGLPGPFDDVERLQYSYADLFLYRNSVDPERLLNAGRMMVLALSLLLGLLLFLWSRSLFGERAALACLALWAFFPPFIAHGTLVTTDMAVTLGYTATLYLAWRWWRAHVAGRSGWPETVGVGLALGLLLAAKYSGAFALPVLGLLVAVGVSTRRIAPRRVLVQGVAAGLVAAAALLAVYQFNSLALWFWPGFRNVFAGATGGRPAFFLGEHSDRGWLHYFPVLFLLKTPLPVILAFSLAAFTRRAWSREVTLFVLLPALLYFSVACLAKINIGHRHILPVYPLLMVWASRLAAAPEVPRAPASRRRLALGGALAVWYVLGTLRVHPWHLSSFNELAGSPARGYLYASDSNVDWGQGLKALGEHLRREGIDGVYLSYFGSADPSYYGIRYLPVGWFHGLTPEYFAEARRGDPSVAAQPRTVLAVSATNLHGTYFTIKDYFSFLRPLTPDAVVADSILIYDLDRHPEQRRFFHWQLSGPPPI